jgi:predicted TIM-barrel fold metal-dependent hydrolase
MTEKTHLSAWRKDVPIIDSHTHLIPKALEHAVKIMDRNGLAMMLDITPNFGEKQEAISKEMAKYPGRFGWFAGIDFRGFGEPGWVKREYDSLQRMVEIGAAGVKFAKNVGLRAKDLHGKLVNIDDERLAPVIEKAGELGIVVAFHTADPKAFFLPYNEKNERWEELKHNPNWWFGDRAKYPTWWEMIRRLEKVVANHPNTTIMGVHFGCAAEEVGYVIEVMRDHPNYIVDIAARVGELGRVEASLMRDYFIEMQDRILFGTDLGLWEPIMLGAPQGFVPTEEDIDKFYQDHWLYLETDLVQIDHPTPIQGNWKVDAVNLPREVLEKVYHKNARHYLLRED